MPGTARAHNEQRELRAYLARVSREHGHSTENDRRLDTLLGLASRHALYGTSPSEPVREILHMIGDKWTSLILSVLKSGACRYSMLRELVSILSHERTISHRVLTSKLRQLQRNGLIKRKIWPSVPPRVEYELSQTGFVLTGLVEEFFSWAELNYQDIQKARAGFDASLETELPEVCD